MSTSADDSETRVCAHGSPASDAAVRWPTREAVLCNAPITLADVIAPALTTMRSESVQIRVERWQQRHVHHIVDCHGRPRSLGPGPHRPASMASLEG
jgi:nucleotide-binding universal stress UspA family protein